MNIITSLRIIGPTESISKFIYDNIQVDDPTEEDYQLWNCKNFLIKNNLVNKDTIFLIQLLQFLIFSIDMKKQSVKIIF